MLRNVADREKQRIIAWFVEFGVRPLLGNFILALFWVVTVTPAAAQSNLGDSDVLILVNAASPVSRSVADMYRRYHPGITSAQVLSLSGLADCASTTAGPANEILTRDQFESLIAQPTRNYLVSSGLVNSVYCIITTAGMPYRIEDTSPTLADVVKPAGSDPWLTVNNRDTVNAASVESELAALFQIDPAITTSAKMPINGRVVNPYQGYSSGIKSWSGIRDILTRRGTFRWTWMWRVTKSPKIEGEFDSNGFSAWNRRMSPADLYLVARLDGPRVQGQYPIFSIRRMLDRAIAASSSTTGYGAAKATVVVDEAPGAADEYAYTQTYNFPPQYYCLDFATNPTPPGAEAYGVYFNEGNHFVRAFNWLTGLTPPAGTMVSASIAVGLGGTTLWDDTNSIMSSAFLPQGVGLLGLLTYGCNGGDGRPANYLTTSGPGGGPLFVCSPGAVFCSLESYNAVTMFTNAVTGQGKIAQFVDIGGTAAIGHSFEPEGSALIQGEFLLRNLLRDENRDGTGDLTLVEAAFSAVPYLSWSEVLIGDPLMRLRTGPGGLVRLQECAGDINLDGRINGFDYLILSNSWNTWIGASNYNPRADLDEDGYVGPNDLWVLLTKWGTVCSTN